MDPTLIRNVACVGPMYINSLLYQIFSAGDFSRFYPSKDSILPMIEFVPFQMNSPFAGNHAKF